MSRSSIVGLLAGGAQRTAAAIVRVGASGRRRRAGSDGRSARPARVEGRPQEVARGVAGEDAPGPVAAVGRRRQPDDQDAARRDRRTRAAAGPSRARRGSGRPSRGRRARARRPAAGSGRQATISSRRASSAAARAAAAAPASGAGLAVTAASAPGPRLALQQQLVEPSRRDRQADDAHHAQVRHVDEQARRDRPDRQASG